MKIYKVVLLLLCITYIYSANERCIDIESPSVESCSKGLTQIDINNGLAKCCFGKYKEHKNSEEKVICGAITQNQFDNIDYVIHMAKIMSGRYEMSIDCGSIFFKFSFLCLILILL